MHAYLPRWYGPVDWQGMNDASPSQLTARHARFQAIALESVDVKAHTNNV
jgi:hypothetical protein